MPQLPVVSEADQGWQRLHPLSPLLRGGVVLLAILGYVAVQLVDRVLSSIRVGPGSGDSATPDGGPLDQAGAYPLIAVLAVVVFVAVVALVSWVSWRFSRFRVGHGQVELRTGVLFRQHRQVALERIQAVELGRPLLARVVGLAQVVVQSAGGADSNLTLAFLDNRRAEELRLRLLELAARTDETRPGDDAGGPTTEVGGTRGAETAAAPPSATPAPGGARAPAVEDATPLVTVPNGRLFLATVLHGSTIVLGGLALVVFGTGSFGELAFVFAGVPALLPVAFGVAISRVRELLTNGNFSVAHTGTALRIRHGLTDLRVSTVPLHRVQAVEVLQPLWWRPWGWWRVRVNVAGIQGSGEDSLETVLLPVGGIDDVLTVLVTLGARREDPRVTEALLGAGGEPGWVGLPRQARWLDPWVWRRASYLLAPQAVLLRRGRLTRRTAVVPYARVQSLSLSQGPLQRRLGLASATVVSTPGPVSARLDHLTVGDAERLLDSLAARARVARRAVPPPDRAPGAGTPATPLAPGAAPLVD